MTSTLIVRGGKPLVGDVEVRGAKNLVSKAMVATITRVSWPIAALTRTLALL